MNPNLPDVPFALLDHRSAQLRTDFAAASPRRKRTEQRADRPQRRLAWVRRALPVHRHA